MPDHPEDSHLGLEQGDLLLLEQGGYLVLEQSEGAGLSRLRQDGEEPYSFLMLEDGSGDLLLEEQPRISAIVS